MSECRLCMAVRVNGETPDRVTTMANGTRKQVFLCQTCRSELEHMGVEIADGW